MMIKILALSNAHESNSWGITDDNLAFILKRKTLKIYSADEDSITGMSAFQLLILAYTVLHFNAC